MPEKNPNHRLLLVDDEQDFLRACRLALSRRGFEVETASNGLSALELLGQERFDVVVLDVKMPEIDGVEVFHRIYHQWRDLPVVMLTGHGTVEQAFQTSREGVFDYLSKPVDMDYLASVCRRAIEERAAARRAPVRESDDDEVRVILVDDETELLEALAKVLKRRTMTVDVASTAAAALELFDAQTFDVAVVDIKLPDIDGLELLRSIKRVSPTTEVIILTGHPTISTALQGLRHGAFDFFVKPHDPESLARSIREAFRKKKTKEREDLDHMIEDLKSKSPT